MKMSKIVKKTVNTGKNVTRSIVNGTGTALCGTGLAAYCAGDAVGKAVHVVAVTPGVLVGMTGSSMVRHTSKNKVNKNEENRVEA